MTCMMDVGRAVLHEHNGLSGLCKDVYSTKGSKVTGVYIMTSISSGIDILSVLFIKWSENGYSDAV